MDRTPSARTENPTFNVRPSSENLYFGIYNSDNGPIFIPHICHFFYTDRIFENQILHPKKRLKAPKTLKMSLKKSNICIFFHSIWKNLHLTKNFYTDMSVVSVTNMRYANLLFIVRHFFPLMLLHLDGKFTIFHPSIHIPRDQNHPQ